MDPGSYTLWVFGMDGDTEGHVTLPMAKSQWGGEAAVSERVPSPLLTVYPGRDITGQFNTGL